MAEIASERILQRLQSPFSGRTGADYWSSIYADRTEAAAVIALLRSELDATRAELELLMRRLGEVEAEYARVAEAAPTAERRGYELAVSQVYEALRRDPTANAASLILQVSQQVAPPSPAPPPRESDVWRELDEELNSLRRKAGRSDAAP